MRRPTADGELVRARLFAAAADYAVGNFHRAMGAELAGVLEDAGPADSDALWFRAWFDRRRATSLAV